jgi:L-amino acid N-acyltransferase YncA
VLESPALHFGRSTEARRAATASSMTPNIIVRPTAETDLPTITAIYAEAVRAGPASFELKAPDAAEMARRWRNRVVKGYPHLVTLRDDVVVGYAYASRFRTSAAYRFLVEDSIYIAPEAQGAGLGRALLTELITQCEGLGYRQMIALIAGGTENTSSIRLHDRLGFRQVGLIEGSAFKHGRWIDTVLMLRALGEGKASLPRDG